MKSLSIIIPTFNDEKIIKKKLIYLFNKIKKAKLNFEIIVINDGSTDKTLNELKSIGNKIKVINNSSNRGKSYSIRRGLVKSKFQHIILIDSDLPYFEKFDLIIQKLKKKYDFVFINRRHPNSRLIENNSLYKYLRNFISFLISLLLKRCLNFEDKKIDTQAGLKGFKKLNNFRNIKFFSNKFFLDIELLYLYYNNKKKITSIPVTYKISRNSSIKIYKIFSNLQILFELTFVLLSLILKNINNKN